MRMKRPQGYKHVKCPHCGGKIRMLFRTMHRMKIEAEKTTPFPPDEEMSGGIRAAHPQEEEGG